MKNPFKKKLTNDINEIDTRYGSRELMQLWFDVDKYFKEERYKLNVDLKELRPSLSNLKEKSNLIGVEVGMGNGLNTQNILKNLDIKRLYVIDRNYPPLPPGEDVLNDNRVSFLLGDSIDSLKKIEEKLDFVYLDASHQYEYLIKEIEIVYHKLVLGGLLGGHDYDQIGVCTAVQTFMMNLWKYNKKKPNNFYIDSCNDNHPGYPEEYLEFGFPIDWWMIKEIELPENFIINRLRNG